MPVADSARRDARLLRVIADLVATCTILGNAMYRLDLRATAMT